MSTERSLRLSRESHRKIADPKRVAKLLSDKHAMIACRPGESDAARGESDPCQACVSNRAVPALR